jgi:hypothetical protein
LAFQTFLNWLHTGAGYQHKTEDGHCRKTHQAEGKMVGFHDVMFFDVGQSSALR